MPGPDPPDDPEGPTPREIGGEPPVPDTPPSEAGLHRRSTQVLDRDAARKDLKFWLDQPLDTPTPPPDTRAEGWRDIALMSMGLLLGLLLAFFAAYLLSGCP